MRVLFASIFLVYHSPMKDNNRNNGHYHLSDKNTNDNDDTKTSIIDSDNVTADWTAHKSTNNDNIIIMNRSSSAYNSSSSTITTITDTITTTKTQQLRGRWGTKVDALLRDLLELTEKHPEEKAIVFSQWIEVSSNLVMASIPIITPVM